MKQSKHLWEGRHDKPGVRFTQNGVWDDGILCKLHEDASGRGDDYAIEWCRRSKAIVDQHPAATEFELEVTEPAKLITFAYATIWKHVVCRQGRELNLALGPYKEPLERHLYEDGPAELKTFVAVNSMKSRDGSRFDFAETPHRKRLHGYNFWQFTVGGFDFLVAADQQPLPNSWMKYALGDPGLAHVVQISAFEAAERPHIRQIFTNISTQFPAFGILNSEQWRSR